MSLLLVLADLDIVHPDCVVKKNESLGKRGWWGNS